MGNKGSQLRNDPGYIVAVHASHSRLSPPCDEGFTQEEHQWIPGFKPAAGLGAGRRQFEARADSSRQIRKARFLV